MELRPYQLEAIEAVRCELGRVRSTLLVLATGLGKTVAFGGIAERCARRGRRVLVLAHRGELLEQAAATLERFGLSVGIEQGARQVDPLCLPDVVVASVQTLRGKRLARFAPDEFGLVVVDECHHATSPSYRAVLEHFTAAKVLGVTATPDRADGVGLRNVFESVAYRMELGEGIKAGWLSPLELRTVTVDALDISQVRTVAGDFAVGELERELMRDGVLHQVAAPLADLSADRPTIAFVAGVAQAHALAEVLRGYGVTAAAVDGSMSAEQREAVRVAFRSGAVRVVTNAMLWTEGFDAPETSCVALVRPTRSRALVTQMIGRGTRLAEGKGACLVLDFVPGRMARVQLASPADALAGEDLPAGVAALVRQASGGEAGELEALIAQARTDQAAAEAAARAAELEHQAAELAERRRLVRTVGVVYAAPRMDVAQLLEAMCGREPPGWRPEWQRRGASPGQVAKLRELGFDVPDTLSHRDAKALFDVLDQRRTVGLCTIKQARKLRAYGLRDDVSFADASRALTIIAENGWKPPVWLLSDPAFASECAA
jgi:superfamily II DNA or RNA helicase